MGGAGECSFSLVVPLHDEEENVPALLAELGQVLPPLGPFEVIAVDDGSRDATFLRLRAAKEEGASWLRVLKLARRAGQSGALAAGFDAARGRILGMMDGDLQNDPRDLAPMLAPLAAGEADMVSGVRRRRRDNLVRRISSRVANGVRNWLTGDRVVDSACGIKVLRREAWRGVSRFDGLHRFLPTLVRFQGWRVVEVDVNHRPRRAGTAKYGLGNRALRGLVDCLGIRWLRRRRVAPRVEREV